MNPVAKAYVDGMFAGSHVFWSMFEPKPTGSSVGAKFIPEIIDRCTERFADEALPYLFAIILYFLEGEDD